jgi:radical SAM superfamily enzyme YgiQ (UPF0313 family)
MLVNPRPLWDRLGPMERFSPAIPPLGVVWPATVLNRAGHTVAVVDQHALKMDTAGLMANVRRFNPRLIGFSALTFAMDGVEDAVAAVRSQLPHTRIVLGNLHAAVFHKELVARRIADFVIRCEGEDALLRLVNALEKGHDADGIPGITWFDGKDIIVNPDGPDLDMATLPVPDWSLVSGIRYEAFRIRRFDAGPLPAAVQASRGCQFQCRFCSQNIMHRRLRTRPVPLVVREISALHEKLGVTALGFVDSNFPPTRSYGLEFATAMKAAGLHRSVRWFTELRLDMADEELIRECASAGMALVQFGVESGNRDVLAAMGKSQGCRDLAAPFAWCRANGVLTVGLFVIGMPGETEQQIEETIASALALDPDLAKFSVATPYPGSGLWHDHLDALKDAAYHKFSGWLDPHTGGAHLLEPWTLPSARLAALQRSAMRRFYARPRKLARLFAGGLIRPATLLQGVGSLIKARRNRIK